MLSNRFGEPSRVSGRFPQSVRSPKRQSACLCSWSASSTTPAIVIRETDAQGDSTLEDVRRIGASEPTSMAETSR
jgi:hypothetical protein